MLNFEYLNINIIKKFIKKKAKSRSHAIDSKYIISSKHHTIPKQVINTNALNVVKRLNTAGYQAYLVGGAVRDLLINHRPKDFDVATNATPQQVKKLFRSARIIGRRFKLIHIPFYREIIEVATFRAHEPVNTLANEHGMLVEDNVYGTLEQDAWRRDFTVNALYYHVEDHSIVDFTQGFQDVQNKQIRMIGDPITRYHEDPVRMLRAVRFSAKLHFSISPETAAPIPQLSHLITQVSHSRLFDEIVKLYQCGNASAVQPLIESLGLFAHLFPLTTPLWSKSPSVRELFMLALESTDTRIKSEKTVNPAFLFAVILWFPMQMRMHALREKGVDPFPAMDQAMAQILTEQSKIIMIPKRHAQTIRDIWLLQQRFGKRSGHRAQHLMQHPRFRAAYDFLVLRALAKDESLDLANWWTNFQEGDEQTQKAMIQTHTLSSGDQRS